MDGKVVLGERERACVYEREKEKKEKGREKEK